MDYGRYIDAIPVALGARRHNCDAGVGRGLLYCGVVVSEIANEDGQLRRRLDSTFGGSDRAARTALDRIELEEQISIVLRVAVRPAIIEVPVSNQLACGAATIVQESEPEHVSSELRRLFAGLPLTGDQLLSVMVVVTRLAELPDDLL